MYSDPLSREDIIRRFTYHEPKVEQALKFDEVTQGFLDLALAMEQMIPPSRERTTAFTLLQQARMMFNAALACNE